MIDPEQAAYEPHTFVERGRSSFTGKERAAICSRGERNGPPEDCGGIWGLDELIKLRDRAATKERLSADDRERLEWLGNWNPEWLDLATINQNLARIRVKKAMMR